MSAALVLGGGAVLAVQLVGSGTAGHEPPKGVSAGVSALDRLPPASNVPADVVRFVQFVAPQRGIDPKRALAEIRRLRSNLGATHADLYAFRSGRGAPCFVLVDQVGACARSAADGSPGLHWTIGGGYGDVPSSLVGIASDDVQSVELTVDGDPVPVSLANNAVFAEYPSGSQRAEITIHRKDGTQSTVHVQLAQPL